MIQSLGVRLLSVFAAALLASAATPQGLGPPNLRMSGGSRRHRGLPVRQVPFPLLSKLVPIGLIFPEKMRFIEMGAYATDLTPAAVPGLKKQVPAVQLVYGYKKGGIGCVYEMPIQPGLNALTVFQATLKSGTFKDRQYFKEWTIKAVPDKKLLIAVSGTTPEVQAELVKALVRR